MRLHVLCLLVASLHALTVSAFRLLRERKDRLALSPAKLPLGAVSEAPVLGGRPLHFNHSNASNVSSLSSPSSFGSLSSLSRSLRSFRVARDSADNLVEAALQRLGNATAGGGAELESGGPLLYAHFAESMGVLFSITVLCYFIGNRCCRRGIKSEKVLQLRGRLELERKKFNSFVDDMLETLEAIEENSSHVAECRFTEKFRSLVHFCESAQEERSGSTNAILIARYRKFMLLWMRAFEDCALDPEHNPCILCMDDLRDVKTSGDIFTRIQAELDQNNPDFAVSGMLNAKKFHDEINQDKERQEARGQSKWLEPMLRIAFTWRFPPDKNTSFPFRLMIPFLKLRINSDWHLWLLTSFFGGLAWAVFLHATSRHAVGVAVDVAICLLAVTLAGVDTLEEKVILERELKNLASQKRKVDELHSSIVVWRLKYDRVCLLWKQGMTKLDLMEEMSNAFWTMGGSNNEFDLGWDPLREVNEKLEAILDGFGSPGQYLNCTYDEDWLSHANDQMNESVRKISDTIYAKQWEQMVKHLDNFFGFVFLRIHAAKGLPMSEGGFFVSSEPPSAYVVGYASEQVNQQGDVCCRTMAKQADCNPRWMEDFQFPIRGEEVLTLEVHDEAQEIGYMTVSIRETPGQWVKKRSRLRARKGQVDKGSLDIELFFGHGVDHFMRDMCDLCKNDEDH